MRYSCIIAAVLVVFLTGSVAGVVLFGNIGASDGFSGKVVPPHQSPDTVRVILGEGEGAKDIRHPSPDNSPDGGGTESGKDEALPSVPPVVPALTDEPGVVMDGPGAVDEEAAPSPSSRPPAPPSPAASTAARVEVKPDPPRDAWAAFNGQSTQISLTGVVEPAAVTFAAWIWLARPASEMNVIASSRFSGCEGGSSHDGFTFHVNEWGTGNRQLRLEWSDASSGSGCQTLASPNDAIPLEMWTHVAFSFGPAGSILRGSASGANGEAALFVNGERVASMSDVRHKRQADKTLTIGATADSSLFFHGRISSIILLRGVVKPAQLASIVAAGSAVKFRTLVADAEKFVSSALMLYGSDTQGARGGAAADTATEVEVLAGKAAVEKDEEPMREQEGLVVDVDAGPKPGPGLPESLPPPPPPAERVKVAEDRFDSGGNQWVTKLIKLESSRVSGTVEDAEALAAGSFSDDVSKEDLVRSDVTGRERAEKIKAGMQFIWKSYKDKAWGADELRPRSGTSQNNWGGMAFTMIDALDTLWVMGMRTEFDECTEWIKANLHFSVPRSVSVFETTIRGLGGLLAAYDMSGERVYLEKAKDLADRLSESFNTPTGIPMAQINLQSGQGHNSGWTGSASVLAELGTVQVEHRYLSHATGLKYYGKKAEHVIKVLRRHKQPHGLYPIYVSPQTGQPTNRQITFGALGDSFYEYLVKVWVQGGALAQSEDRFFRDMYDEAMQGLHDLLIQETTPSHLRYVADYNGAQAVHKMDHLVCFVPGMLALGAWTADGTKGQSHIQRDLQVAKAVAYTCYQMYARQATGIAPEFVEFRAGADIVVPGRAPFYILRPEAAESLFVLHQLTGNPIYREWGWNMWQSIDRYCKTTYGYGAHPDVRDTSRQPDDRMESFFLAETMKYLYMLQSPDHPISLERFVFNTEAHPMRRFDHWGSNENKVDWGFAGKATTGEPAGTPSLRGAETKANAKMVKRGPGWAEFTAQRGG